MRGELADSATQRLLDAMDGIALIMDADLTILQVGEPNWTQFLKHNGGTSDIQEKCSINVIVGQPITTFLAGETVKNAFADLFRSVLDGRRKAIRLDYRCDAPEFRRDMRLAVTPLAAGEAQQRLLYQSIVLSTQPRVPLPMFAAEIAGEENADILTLCAICARVAWPVGAPSGARDWIDPEEYYRRGGAQAVKISHGFCERCFSRLNEMD